MEEARGLSVEELRGAVEDGIIVAVSICTPDLQELEAVEREVSDVELRRGFEWA